MFNKSLFKVFENIKDGICIIDEKYNIIFLNKAGRCICNISFDKIENKNIFLILPSVRKKNIQWLESVRNGQVISEKIHKLTIYNGEIVEVLSSIYPILEKDKLCGIIIIFNRINENDENKKLASLPDISKILNNNLSINRVSYYDFIDIIGNSEKILEVKHKAFMACKTSSPVLIYGETGTGKELFVQAIHSNSYTKDKPFIAQNCAAIPKELFESILFGTVKGSFTGAESRKGLFEIANGGTLYLDELNSMPLELQAKLLRTLQEGIIMRVGENICTEVDVRVVASVNEEPEYLIKSGRLRKDLYFRLNVVSIKIPPLRDRKEDIPLLVNYFINKFNQKFNKNVKGIEKGALEKLIMENWYGNVRELEHNIEAAFNESDTNVLKLECFKNLKKPGEGINNNSLKNKIENLEIKCIKEAIIICNNNITKTAERLSIPRQTLQYKIKKYHIDI